MILSVISNRRLEDVAAAAPGGLRWMQTYMFRDKKLVEIIIRRAERSGYKGLVLTVDDPREGKRYKTLGFGWEGIYKQEGLG